MKLYIIKPVCMMFLSESAFCSARLRLLCRRKESAGGLRPAKLSALAQGSSSDLQCCSTTLFTAAADSANWDRARAELFLRTRASV